MFDILVKALKDNFIYFSKSDNGNITIIEPFLVDITLIFKIRNNSDVIILEKMLKNISTYNGYIRYDNFDDAIKVVLQF